MRRRRSCSEPSYSQWVGFGSDLLVGQCLCPSIQRNGRQGRYNPCNWRPGLRGIKWIIKYNVIGVLQRITPHCSLHTLGQPSLPISSGLAGSGYVSSAPLSA